MMMPADTLKAAWTIRAGVIPGEPVGELSKRIEYSAGEWEIDKSHNGEPGYHAIFSRKRSEALDFYAQVSFPRLTNWAELVFLWY